MAYVPYVRLVIGGVIDTAQSWSMGMSFSNDGTATNAELLTWLGAITTPIHAWLTSSDVLACWGTTTIANQLRAYSYPALGGAASQSSVFITPITGDGGTPLPRQLSIVHSLRSAVAGRKGRGRFYMPFTSGANLDATGQASSAHVTNLAAEFKTFVDAANVLDIGAAPALLGVASRDSGFDVVSTAVIVNSKIDTQRRRTDKVAITSSAESTF